MPGMGNGRASAGLYPLVVGGAAIMIVLSFALLGYGAATMPTTGDPAASGTLEAACTGFTCAPLVVPAVLVVAVGVLLAASAVMRATA